MMNIQDLEYQEFEILVGLILKRIGHQIIRSPQSNLARGPDFETISPDGYPVVVEVKHFKRGVPKSLLRQFIGDLERYRKQNERFKGILVLSSEVSLGALIGLENLSGIDIWDVRYIQAMLTKHSEILPVFDSLQKSKASFATQVASLMGAPQKRSEELCSKLRNVPCGKEGWQAYEKFCTEILTYVFTPDLGPPDIQSRSDDGLDIIDAIFPIRSDSSPWSIVRSEFQTRFIVAEFKNYCEPIGQGQVESIAQYLWNKAHRTFGLLVSRENPSTHARAQRRRQWLENEKMIVLLTDSDLCEMLQLKESKGRPYDVIDTQLEDFLRTLTP
jgi:hypothetical protein